MLSFRTAIPLPEGDDLIADRNFLRARLANIAARRTAMGPPVSTEMMRRVAKATELLEPILRTFRERSSAHNSLDAEARELARLLGEKIDTEPEAVQRVNVGWQALLGAFSGAVAVLQPAPDGGGHASVRQLMTMLARAPEADAAAVALARSLLEQGAP